ncbi:hypothetical protein [Roseateles aquatilis]|uniref:hypothetical protein n=1 Tax=Roseateles aquatilis TaxID=431061 RepID=UPI0011310779|nr:hypothetical protein [Roseateles aquatilis]
MRQRNVQQQNASVEASIRAEAVYWRATRWPGALLDVAEGRGVDCRRAIIVDLDIDFPGTSRLFGLLLTADEIFIEFEIETDPSHAHVEGIAEWKDVTGKQNLSRHNRGTGWGKGALALQVLHQLNTPPEATCQCKSLD